MTQTVPLGARCGKHPEETAVLVCGRCGTFACVGCTTNQYAPGTLNALCATCAAAVPPQMPATRSSRFAANLVDQMVVFLPSVMVGMVYGIAAGVSSFDREHVSELFGPLLLAGAVSFGLLVGTVVQIYFQSVHGRSVGKRLLGIKVLRCDGSEPGLWRIVLLRNVLVHVVAQLCGLVGLLDALMIFGDERRCLHDLIADTIVVERAAEGDPQRRTGYLLS